MFNNSFSSPESPADPNRMAIAQGCLMSIENYLNEAIALLQVKFLFQLLRL
ncbi:hypothetical protein [Microcoleus sp. N3A4]|uniref:hypothetical protein n=1 Tax=Microcoleus sp. N3A4 TaxID=3055379 RepID=UPI002FCFC099